jgi:hypothetical protein
MTTPAFLRATSDALMRDLAALAALEDEKRTLPFEDPRLVEIAEQVHSIAQRVLAGTKRQTDLAREVADSPVANMTSIEDIPRPLAAILGEWREVERRAAEAAEGSAEAAELDVLATRLRDEYRAAYAKANAPG